MRYSYLITDKDGQTETLEAMSLKKVKKQIDSKYPDQRVNCAYTNKRGKKLDITIRGRGK